MKIDNTNQQENELELQGKQIARLLDAHANRLSMRTLKQLENARAQAVLVHQQKSAGATVNTDGTLSHFAFWAGHHRLMTTGLLLAAILFGFVLMQMLSTDEASDAFLLGAELPPEAFVDRGFEPSLNKFDI